MGIFGKLNLSIRIICSVILMGICVILFGLVGGYFDGLLNLYCGLVFYLNLGFECGFELVVSVGVLLFDCYFLG